MLPILNPKEFVLAAFILEVFPVELPSQPLASIDADLNLEGEPRLQAHIHPAEQRVNEVVIQLRAFTAVAAYLPEPLGVFLFRECPARFDTLQHAHQPFFHLTLARKFPRRFLLGYLAGIQVAETLQFSGPRNQRRRQELRRYSGSVRLEITTQDMIEREQVVHSLRVIELP